MSKRTPVSVFLNTDTLSRSVGRMAKKFDFDKSDGLNITAAEILGQNQNWGALLHKDGPVTALRAEAETKKVKPQSLGLNGRLFMEVKHAFRKILV